MRWMIALVVSFVCSFGYLALVDQVGVDDWWNVSEDTTDYVNAAQHIERGTYYSPPAMVIGKVDEGLYQFYRTPAFPLWLVITRYATWLGPLYAMLLTLLTYGLTMRLFDDDRHAFVAALLVAVSPTVIFLTPFLLTDLPATVLVLLGVWLLTFASTNRWLLAGLSFAAATFTRPSSMIYVVVAVGVFALVSMNWKRIAVFIASFGVPVLSWMLIVFAHTGSFAMSTQGTVALMQYGAFYGIVGPQTSKIAKAHAETRMDVVDLVRDAGTEKERIARERAVISERIGQNRVGYWYGFVYNMGVTLLTPSKDVFSAFPWLYNRYVLERIARALLSCVYFGIVAVGFVGLAGKKNDAVVGALTVGIVFASMALGGFAGTVMGQRVMLPTLPFTSMLVYIGALRLMKFARRHGGGA